LKISPSYLRVCGGTNPPHPQFYALKGRELTPIEIKKNINSSKIINAIDSVEGYADLLPIHNSLLYCSISDLLFIHVFTKIIYSNSWIINRLMIMNNRRASPAVSLTFTLYVDPEFSSP
jgi:hypothetical protein